MYLHRHRSQIENRFLLERFERAAQTRGPCKVKGLFCHVPDESLEHVVLYGMGGAGSLMDGGGGDGGGGSGGASSAGWDGDPIDFFWGAPTTKAAGRRGGGGGKSESGSDAVTTAAAAGTGGAGARPKGSGDGKKPLEFPRAFSRHSTLEEEHGYANNNREFDGEECGAQQHHRPWSPPSAGVIGALASPLSVDSRLRQGQRRRHHAAGEGPAEDGRQGDAVSGLRFLALCRVMIGSMHVATAPSPTVTAQRKGTGSDGGMSSHDYSSSATGPLEAPFSLPPPPPGQAEFDSVYFPREEEYRLLNEAFVLPEFLVVHRFVAAATPLRPASHSGSGRSSPPSSAGSAAAARNGAGSVSSAVIEGKRQQPPAVGGVSTKGKGGAEKRATGVRGRERGQQQQQQNDRRCHPSDDARGGIAPPSASAMPQDAASVVAGIEAAMESPVLPQRTNLHSRSVRGSSMPWEGVAAPCSLASSSGCAGGDSTFSLSRGGRDGGLSGSLLFELNGGSGDVGATSDGSSDGGRSQGRGRERDNGRASRDSIVRGVELECEHPLDGLCLPRFCPLFRCL